MNKAGKLWLAVIFVISFLFSTITFYSKHLKVYGQFENTCVCATGAYYDEAQAICVIGTLFCEDNSDPVCGCDSKDYLNTCVAQANGIKSFTKGACSTTSTLSCMTDAQCPLGTCTSGGTFQKFKCDLNMCTLMSFSSEPCTSSSSSSSSGCTCATGEIFNGTACSTSSLDCTGLLEDAVCGCDDKDYLNSCVAQANGVQTFTKGTCSSSETASCTIDDHCPLGTCPDGTTYKRSSCVSNQCTRISFSEDPCELTSCTCAIGEYFDGENCVEGEILCTLESDSVCGCDGVTYSNSCLARAAGIKEFTNGECSSTVVLSCSKDADCPDGICEDGKLFKRFSCGSNSQCEELVYVVDPCESLSTSGGSSSSGGKEFSKISKNLTGFWLANVVKCFPKEKPEPNFDSDDCIVCPQVAVSCSDGSVLVPQSCNACAHCEDCQDVQIGLQLCVEKNQLTGIINHNRYLDRAVITTEKVARRRKVLASTLSESLGTEVEIKLQLGRKKKKQLIGNLDNMLYLERFRAKKINSKACPVVTDKGSDCCRGYVLPSSSTKCTANFSSTQCLSSEINTSASVCCPVSSSCVVPCGSQCCAENETCRLSNPCSDGNPLCFANSSLSCIDCSSRGSCSISEGLCPAGTQCTGAPDFLCIPTGCPQ